MKHFRLKYLILLSVALAIVHIVFGSAVPRPLVQSAAEQVPRRDSQKLADAVRDTNSTNRENARQQRARRVRRLRDTVAKSPQRDTLIVADSLAKDSLAKDSVTTAQISQRDTTARKKGGSPIEQIIQGKNTDSLYYDVRNKRVYIYNKGDVKYDNMSLQSDYMQIDMSTKEIYAYGKVDSVDGAAKNTHPVFNEGGSSYTMDTIK